MKNFKLSFAYLAMFAMIFASCSKDENPIDNPGGETTATLSFATVLNDLVANKAAMKQTMDEMPDCSGAAPAYVEVVLAGTENVGSEEDPLIIDVSPNPGDYDGDGEEEYFTEESTELELTPGNYTLEHFVVFDANGNEIWVAPMTGSEMANFVDTTLPMSFDLVAGAKQYVDVEVLCFDDRMVNEYGYLFFDFNGTEAIEFCFFGNYCDENGRHYAAEYSVSVWTYEDGAIGEALYTEVSNNVDMVDGEYAADPLCIALPDSDGLDEYYIEVTIEDSEAYGDIENRIIREGVINDDLVRTFFDGENNLDYYHFREGECETEDPTPILPDPQDEAENYKACLYPINGSGAIAFAYFSVEGNTLEATVLGYGLEPNMVHPQHIHGFGDDSISTCPDASAADNIEDDGLVSIAEGKPFYGPVLLPLTMDDGTFPTANAEGMVIYQNTFELDNTDLDPLENRAVVLHGMTVNGEYNATLPVACGTVSWLQ